MTVQCATQTLYLPKCLASNVVSKGQAAYLIFSRILELVPDTKGQPWQWHLLRAVIYTTITCQDGVVMSMGSPDC